MELLQASRDNIGISHLFFADDLILFVKVDEDSCKAISEVLDEFCEESGQKVSMEESRIYFSPNVQSKIKSGICSRLGIQATTNIGNYLGFPIKHRGVPRNRLNFIVEKVMSKLAGWKARFLSFAGRFVLVKSVMSTIPNYIMQTTALPTHLCEKLDKINGTFCGDQQVKGEDFIWLVGIRLLGRRKREALGFKLLNLRNWLY